VECDGGLVTEPFYDEHDVDKLYPIVIPYGYCHCGCGEKTTLSKVLTKNREVRIGQLNKYIVGHSRRSKLQVLHGVKVCGVCKVIKPLDEYFIRKRTHAGKSFETQEHFCRKCKAKLAQEYNRKTKYGLTAEAFTQLMTKQKSRCAVCAEKFPKSSRSIDKLCIDHCHTSGEVRGLLCDGCNKGLGHFKDNIQSLANAIKYLEAAQV